MEYRRKAIACGDAETCGAFQHRFAPSSRVDREACLLLDKGRVLCYKSTIFAGFPPGGRKSPAVVETAGGDEWSACFAKIG
jgi:hypothetical protein